MPDNRIDFAAAKHSPEYPDFLDIQIKSFQDFFQLETKSDERKEDPMKELKKAYLILLKKIFLLQTREISLC